MSAGMHATTAKREAGMWPGRSVRGGDRCLTGKLVVADVHVTGNRLASTVIASTKPRPPVLLAMRPRAHRPAGPAEFTVSNHILIWREAITRWVATACGPGRQRTCGLRRGRSSSGYLLTALGDRWQRTDTIDSGVTQSSHGSSTCSCTCVSRLSVCLSVCQSRPWKQIFWRARPLRRNVGVLMTPTSLTTASKPWTCV